MAPETLPVSTCLTRLVTLDIAAKMYRCCCLCANGVRISDPEFYEKLYEFLVSICWEILFLQLNCNGLTRGKLQFCQFLVFLNISYLSISDGIFISTNIYSFDNPPSIVFKLLFILWITYEIIILATDTMETSISGDKTSKKAIKIKGSSSENDDTPLLTATEVNAFYKGIPVIIISDDQCLKPENLPFPKKFEISLPQLSTIDHKSFYSNGFYGTGYKGLLRSHRPKGIVEVCIKKNKVDLGANGFKGFLFELKTMLFVGYHENVLTLIGAWTKDISEGFLHIVTEYCENNTLYDYLNRIRTQRVSHSESHGQGFQKSNEFTEAEMYRWAYEIASGMSFIVDKGIIHGSLCTKTTLLTGSKTVKITEFGIASYLPQFRNQNVSLIPLWKDIKNAAAWRNLSWESHVQGNFTVKSDVWSYAVTVWEILTLGEVPYSEFHELSSQFLETVENGARPQLPDFMKQNRATIENCWALDPDERPDFTDILKSMYSLTRPKRRNVSIPY